MSKYTKNTNHNQEINTTEKEKVENKKKDPKYHLIVQLTTHIIFFLLLLIIFALVFISIFIESISTKEVAITAVTSALILLGLYIAAISFTFSYKIYINTKKYSDEDLFLKSLHIDKDDLLFLIKNKNKINELIEKDEDEERINKFEKQEHQIEIIDDL